ncbi:hypothetical protein C8R44DRAFT_873795 [Mycena epipterygia]|nr:hypothetical protein C8R44DRAFT_873795 [Mycena epipterygia]
MGNRRIDSDDSDSDSDSSSDSGDNPQTLSPAQKQRTTKLKEKPLPTIDFTATPPPRSRKPTQKQTENEDRDDVKKDAKIAALKKQLAKANKAHDKTKGELQDRDADRAPPESEEEDDDRVEMSSYSASFVSKGIVSSTAKESAPKKLRKSGETPITTPLSRVPLTDLSSNVLTADVTQNEDGLDEGVTSPPRPSKRPRSLSPSKRRRKRARARAAEAAEEPPLQKAEFVGGKPPGGSRTNLKDYTQPAAKLLKLAMHKYEVRIWTLNPFPPTELQTKWVKEIWDEVGTETEERMELTERMATMIKKYGSHARSTLKDGIRPLVAPTYKFKVGDSDKILRKNVKICKALLNESAFHYEVPKTLTGFAGNPIIIDSMRGIWFKTKAGRGVVYVGYFSPISIVTLALIFTAIEFCIEEYSTGRFQQGMFDEVFNKARYDIHFNDLSDWASLLPAKTDELRQQMHDLCRASTGAGAVKVAGRLTESNRARALLELQAMNVDDAQSDGDDSE